MLEIRKNYEFQLCLSVGKERGKIEGGGRETDLGPLRHSKRVGEYLVQLTSLYLFYWKKSLFQGGKIVWDRDLFQNISGKLDSSQEGLQHFNDSLLNWAVSVKLSSLRWKVFSISTKIGRHRLCPSAHYSLCFRATRQGHNRELSTFCPFKGWWLELP